MDIPHLCEEIDPNCPRCQLNLDELTDDDLPGMWSHSDFIGGQDEAEEIVRRAQGITPHEWKPPFSAASYLCGALVMRGDGGDECGVPRRHPIHQYVGHRLDCPVRKHPPQDYELGNPDSEQHCSRCHCACDPDGPGCGHWAGCPGC